MKLFKKRPSTFETGGQVDIGMPVENLVAVPTTYKFLWGLWSKSHSDLYFTSNTKLYSLKMVSDLLVSDPKPTKSESNGQ